MLRAAAIVGLLIGCSHPPAPMLATRAALITAPWCFPGAATLAGIEVDGLSCWAELWACEYVRNEAERYGSLVGVVELGACAQR